MHGGDFALQRPRHQGLATRIASDEAHDDDALPQLDVGARVVSAIDAPHERGLEPVLGDAHGALRQVSTRKTPPQMTASLQ